jgi:hypothetical protein
VPDNLALVRVLEASIETLKAENEILRRCLAVAEARGARETAKAEGAIAELLAIMRLRAQAARPWRWRLVESAQHGLHRGPSKNPGWPLTPEEFSLTSVQKWT